MTDVEYDGVDAAMRGIIDKLDEVKAILDYVDAGTAGGLLAEDVVEDTRELLRAVRRLVKRARYAAMGVEQVESAAAARRWAEHRAKVESER